MNVKTLAEKLNLEQKTAVKEDKEITGVYIGDLLSIVMTKCEEGNVWITAQTHQNIVSVAELNDAACIILAGGTNTDDSLIRKATDAGVALLATDMQVYELAWKIHEVL